MYLVFTLFIEFTYMLLRYSLWGVILHQTLYNKGFVFLAPLCDELGKSNLCGMLLQRKDEIRCYSCMAQL